MEIKQTIDNQYKPYFFTLKTLVPASVIWRLRASSSNIDNRVESGPIRLNSANCRRHPPTGSLPRCWGIWFEKNWLDVLRIALQAGLPRGELRSISPGTAGTRGRVRVTRFLRNIFPYAPSQKKICFQ